MDSLEFGIARTLKSHPPDVAALGGAVAALEEFRLKAEAIHAELGLSVPDETVVGAEATLLLTETVRDGLIRGKTPEQIEDDFLDEIGRIAGLDEEE